MRKKTIIIVILIALIAFIGGASAATGFLEYSENIGVSYGDVTYTNSDLNIVDHELVGPGNNVETVDVTIDNTGTSDITANVSVALLDSNGNELTTGQTQSTISAGATGTVVQVSVTKTNQNQIADVDLTLEEV